MGNREKYITISIRDSLCWICGLPSEQFKEFEVQFLGVRCYRDQLDSLVCPSNHGQGATSGAAHKWKLRIHWRRHLRLYEGHKFCFMILFTHGVWLVQDLEGQENFTNRMNSDANLCYIRFQGNKRVNFKAKFFLTKKVHKYSYVKSFLNAYR